MPSFLRLFEEDRVHMRKQHSARPWSPSKRNRTRGHAVIEAALLFPPLVFLFIGVFDMGFYLYAMISVENAVRIAVEYTATSSYTASDTATACTLALNELANVSNLSSVSGCSSLPLKVSATAVSGADGSPASNVSVQYQSDSLIPIPGLLTGRLTLTRAAQMRLRS